MLDITKKERGERIRSLRKKSALTLEALAKEIGVRYQSIGEWERGRTSPSVDNIGRLAMKFNVQPTWIWTGEGPKYIEQKKQKTLDVRDRLESYAAKSPLQADLEYAEKLIDILKGKNEEAIAALKINIDILHKYCLR